MSVDLLPWPKAKFFVPNTNYPLSGGKVYSYIAGTSTPLTTYSDPAGIVPNTNPVILNAQGEASIYLDSSSLYKIDVRDASDVSLSGFPVDNISTFGQILAQLANTSNPALGDALIGVKQPYTSAVARNQHQKNTETISVDDFGAIGDGVTDDTVAIQAAITAAAANGFELLFPGSTYKITAPLVVAGTGVKIFGNGMLQTKLVASGNFASVFSISGTASYVTISDLSVYTTSTSTQCVNVAQNAVVIRFCDCEFYGDLAGDLCYSNGQNVDFFACSFYVGNASTYGIAFDSYNQNSGVQNGCRFGGLGNGIRILNTFSSGNPVQGTRIIGNYFINTGAYNVTIGGNCSTILMHGNVFDQATTTSLLVGASVVQVVAIGNWFGVTAGIGVDLVAGSSNHIFKGNIFNGGSFGMNVRATTGARCHNIQVEGNTFNSHSTSALVLDSVNGFTCANNIDNSSSPSSGSWTTSGTHASKGDYFFSNNRWSSATQLTFDTASTYRFGYEQGLLGKNRGKTVASSGTSQVINHGLIGQPNNISICMEGGNFGAVWVTAVGSTSFTANWASAGTPTIDWWVEI